MYCCTEQDSIKLAVIFMKILNETFKTNHWKEFFSSKYFKIYFYLMIHIYFDP